MDYTYCLRFVLVGDSGCGKTTLLHRFIADVYLVEHVTTLGMEFGVYFLSTPCGKRIKIQVWDTSGQERFRSITRSYYRKSSVVMVLYDISCRDTSYGQSNNVYSSIVSNPVIFFIINFVFIRKIQHICYIYIYIYILNICMVGAEPVQQRILSNPVIFLLYVKIIKKVLYDKSSNRTTLHVPIFTRLHHISH